MTVAELYEDTRQMAILELRKFYKECRKRTRMGLPGGPGASVPPRTAWAWMQRYLKGQDMPYPNLQSLRRIIPRLSPEFVAQLNELRLAMMGENSLITREPEEDDLEEAMRAAEEGLGLG